MDLVRTASPSIDQWRQAAAGALPPRTAFLLHVRRILRTPLRSGALVRDAISRFRRAAGRERGAWKQRLPKRLRVGVGLAGSTGHGADVGSACAARQSEGGAITWRRAGDDHRRAPEGRSARPAIR